MPHDLPGFQPRGDRARGFVSLDPDGQAAAMLADLSACTRQPATTCAAAVLELAGGLYPTIKAQLLASIEGGGSDG